ncbi:MAG: flavin reductase family protein [Spirochaetales bacterium]|nr:flavin reductase family protein [Spirochaetales bacterium]
MKKSLGSEALLYPTPVLIIGTYDSAGKPNGAAVAWGGVCCSDPVCVSVSLRPARYTHKCIKEQQCFTVNIPSEKYMAEADYLGLVSGKDKDKISLAGLTAVKSGIINAPLIAEFPLVLECKLLEAHDLGTHTQFIGQVLDVKIDEDCLNSEGVPDIKKISPLVYSPGDYSYYGIAQLLGKGFSVGKKFI